MTHGSDVRRRIAHQRIAMASSFPTLQSAGALLRVGLTSVATAVVPGYCWCGCGQKTPIVRKGASREGLVRGEPMPAMPGHGRRLPILAAFAVDESGCWLWKHAAIKGYGVLKREGRTVWKAHRWFWEQLNGPLPDGLMLDHLCRVSLCVNPTHLEPVTNAENQQRGAGAKLSREAVAYIRASSRKQDDLAAQFGVAQSTISRVRLGKSWGDAEAVA